MPLPWAVVGWLCPRGPARALRTWGSSLNNPLCLLCGDPSHSPGPQEAEDIEGNDWGPRWGHAELSSAWHMLSGGGTCRQGWELDRCS